MNYPLISEYVAAIQNAADNLDKLSGLKPMMDTHGEPVHSSGAFAVVFKMVDENGKYFALKCFTEEQTGRDEAYRLIADELDGIESKYLTSVRYYDKELFVDSNVSDETEFPVLLMDWIEGETMDVYIADNYQDNSAMEWLCYRFCKMASWLRSQPFAHGDIKPDNIIVNEDGELTLIDYDGMFVPAMKGWKSPTLGTKDFVHPNRKVEDFDETIDDFTLASIALSLKAISLDSSLFDKFGAADRLLFSAADYLNLGKSKIVTAIQPLISNVDLMQLESLFKHALAIGNLSSVILRFSRTEEPRIHVVQLKEKNKPDKEQIIQLTDEKIEKLCKVTNEELESIDWDETGAKYSKDGKRLLKFNNYSSDSFVIKYGTEIICDGAFADCRFINAVTIPNSVLIIGNGAFSYCEQLSSISIPSSVIYIGCGAFRYCKYLTSIDLPVNITKINDYTFESCLRLSSINIPSNITNIGNYVFSHCNISLITIPSSIISIGEGAFWSCKKIESITIPSSVICIGANAFEFCDNLKSIAILSDIISIGEYTFSCCKSLTSIKIPTSVTSIGGYAFKDCWSLDSITIPNSVESIGQSAFSGSSIRSIHIPLHVSHIEENAFQHCRLLGSISVDRQNTFFDSRDNCNAIIETLANKLIAGCYNTIIPNSVSVIGNCAFFGCEFAESIIIPSCILHIGDFAFCNCCYIESITISSYVRTIGKAAFESCSKISSLIIPSSVTSIGDYAFCYCRNLTSITFLSKKINLGKDIFENCYSLKFIHIPKGTILDFIEMLPKELHNILFETPDVQ